MCVGVCHICIYIHVFSCLSRIVCQMSYFITICIYAIYIYDLFLPPYAFSYCETTDKDFSTRFFVVNPGVSMDSMWSEH